MEEQQKYILGIDLGTNSLGWALLKANPSPAENDRLKPYGIKRVGVRVFEEGVKDYDLSKEQSRGKNRREKRLMRRQFERTFRRLSHLYSILQSHSLLPKTAEYSIPLNKSKKPDSSERSQKRISKSEGRHRELNSLDQNLMEKWAKKIAGEGATKEAVKAAKRDLGSKLPYFLRAKALRDKLEPYEIGRIIYHLAQRRGFKSIRKSQQPENEGKGIKGKMKTLQNKIDDGKFITLGNYFSAIPAGLKIRNDHDFDFTEHYTTRGMYEAELRAVWQKQKEFYGDLLRDELKGKIWNAIFDQRPLKSQKHLIGECRYEAGKKRAPVACLEAQEFRILKQVDSIRIEPPDAIAHNLSLDQRAELIKILSEKKELSFEDAKKKLGIEDSKFSIESGGEKKFKGNTTVARLGKFFGKKEWNKLPDEQKKEIADLLVSDKTDAEVEQYGIEKLHLQLDNAREFGQLGLEDGYSALSMMALNKILPIMRKGIPEVTAAREAGYQDLIGLAAEKQLPPVQSHLPELTNPIVKRALTELRKVVNAIIREHGKPESIRIELVRGLKKNKQWRDQIIRDNRENQRRNQEYRAIIENLKELHIEKVEAKHILKWRLAEECGWNCPYSQEGFEPIDLLRDDSPLEVDHIIPQSRVIDDSFNNLAICHHKENRNKSNKTPWEAYHGDPEKYDRIIAAAKKFGNRAKLNRFLWNDEQLKEFVNNFSESQLNDTAFASKEARKYLSLLYGQDALKRVQVGNGAITKTIRGLYHLNRILNDGGDKSRDDLRHHSVDAIAIGITDQWIVTYLNAAFEKAFRVSDKWVYRHLKIDPLAFFNEAKQAILDLKVSHRCDRKVNGEMHKETYYCRPPKENGEYVNGKTFMRLRVYQLDQGTIATIPDDNVRRAVEDKLKELGGNVEALKKNHPTLNGIPIRRVKIPVNLKVEKIGRSCRERFVNTGNNHHIEIIGIQDTTGNIVEWDGEVVTTFEAMRRNKNGEQIIRRDHGPNRKFLFSLSRNESVLMKGADGVESLWTVQKIDKNNILFFVKHNDGRKLSDIPAAGRSRKPESLRIYEAKKVLVTPLGDIRWAND